MVNSLDLDMGRRPKLKSEEFFVAPPLVLEIKLRLYGDCSGKVLHLIGA